MADKPTHVKPGYRVRNPYFAEWWTVTEVTDDGVLFAEGGMMSAAECIEVLLPDEPIPPPGSVDDDIAALPWPPEKAPPGEGRVHL